MRCLCTRAACVVSRHVSSAATSHECRIRRTTRAADTTICFRALTMH
eukprot:COSAG01_NODE_52558_length_345_cov_436.764228_1_plen_46_part_01